MKTTGLESRARVHQVYTECHLNLSLSRSAKPEESFLAGWVPHEIQPFQLDTTSLGLEDPGPTGRKYWVHPSHYSRNVARLSEQPLEKRAWAFQERVLSPRVLSIGLGEVFWSCSRLLQASEVFPEGMPECVSIPSDQDQLNEVIG
jgi:hypothetical protein